MPSAGKPAGSQQGPGLKQVGNCFLIQKVELGSTSEGRRLVMKSGLQKKDKQGKEPGIVV